MAACRSQYVGEIFLKCGARHVVCIKKGEDVLDAAAIKFTSSFYSNIFSGQSVCAAFDKAKAKVEFEHPGESQLYMMLVQEQAKLLFSVVPVPNNAKFEHRCYSLPKSEPGKLENISAHNLAKKIPNKQKGFKYREKEVYKTLDRLLV